MLHLTEATDRAKVWNLLGYIQWHIKFSEWVFSNKLQQKQIIFSQRFSFSQSIVEEIQIKSADLGEIQRSGQDLMEALSGNAHCTW